MPRKSRKNVGLIGLGIIGSRVANALRLRGFHVYVWNRTPRAAPNFLASPRQIAELCDVIQLFIADAHALFDVLDSMGDALTPSHVILCNATVGPEATLDAARLVQERGAQFLDAPFTGSKAAAQNRELVYFIGGDDKTLQAVQPVLQASSKAIVKIGKIGDAAVLKVATNMIAAVTVQTLAEAYAIVKSSGIDPRTLVDALEHHGVRSGVTDAKLPKMLDRDYEAHFTLKHMFKDVQLGIHIANSLDVDLPATTSTAGVMYGGLTRGWADEDFAVIARCYQNDDQPAPSLASPAGSTDTASTGGSAQEKPGDASAAPAPPGAKKEPPRESTSGESRDAGKIPDAPAQLASEKNASHQPRTDAPAAGAPKTEPSNAEAQNAEGASKAEPRKPEPPISGPPKTDSGKSEPQTAGIAAEKSKERTGAEPSGENGTPAAPARQHTPFVRIRRWFGTGPAS